MLRQLSPDILGANEDGLQVRPRALHLKPDHDDRVGSGQLLLPLRHLLQEVANKLGSHHVLQLDLCTEINLLYLKKKSSTQNATQLFSHLVVFQCFYELLAGTNEHDPSAWVWLVIKFHLSPGHIQFLERGETILKNDIHKQIPKL